MHTYIYTQQINPHTHCGLYFNNFFNGNDYICDNCLIYIVWSVIMLSQYAPKEIMYAES